MATAAALVDQWDSVSARSLDGGVVALEATDRALAPWQRFLRTGVMRRSRTWCVTRAMSWLRGQRRTRLGAMRLQHVVVQER